MNDWLYDEYKHCGVDYSDTKQAESYDQQHQQFRNYEKEVADMLDFISVCNPGDMTLVDLGCGTGATAIHASKYFRKIIAVDVSEVMINQAKKKAEQQGITNIEFVNAGFLSYEHETKPADIVVTKAAFHHLPDFWKQVALLKMNKMLDVEGILYICDVVFQFPPSAYVTAINQWISGFEMKAGKEFSAEVATHIRDEFSTFGWVLEGMLRKAGFEIVKNRSADGFLSEYLCRKVEEITIQVPCNLSDTCSR